MTFVIEQIVALVIGLIIFSFILTIGIIEETSNVHIIKNVVFNIKKWFLITAILLLNAGGCALVYYTQNLQVILFIIVVLKSKDIISCVMFVFNMTYRYIVGKYSVKSEDQPRLDEDITKIVAIIPAYKESKAQILSNIRSIINSKCGPHYILPIVVSDGFQNFSSLISVKQSSTSCTYTSWKEEDVDVDIFYGTIDDHDIVFIDKNRNMGKKDTIILANDIFNFPRRGMPQKTTDFRRSVSNDIFSIFGIKDFDCIFFTDGDTVLDEYALHYLRQTLLQNEAIAVCGIVNVCPSAERNLGTFFWDNLQNFQYMYGQYTKRTNEDLFKQVQCLPGCISMIGIDYSFTEINSVFAKCPDKNDFFQTCVNSIGTDRRLTSSILSKAGGAKILQDTRAHAWTLPPQCWSHFLNQRKRWMHNLYFNTMFNVVCKNVNVFLRFLDFLEILRMNLIYFRLFNSCYFIYLLSVYYTPKDVLQLVPYIVLLSWPAVCFIVYAVFDSHLRRNFFKLFLFLIVNKIFTMCTSFIVFSTMLFNIGIFKWNS